MSGVGDALPHQGSPRLRGLGRGARLHRMLREYARSVRDRARMRGRRALEALLPEPLASRLPAPRGSRVSAGDCLIGCVAENHAPYLDQALRLVQSLRWFGGGMAGSRFRACVVGAADPEFRAALEDYGAEVRVVPRFHPANPYANKLQFFTEIGWDEAELFILLDCDVLITRDLAPVLRGEL